MDIICIQYGEEEQIHWEVKGSIGDFNLNKWTIHENTGESNQEVKAQGLQQNSTTFRVKNQTKKKNHQNRNCKQGKIIPSSA